MADTLNTESLLRLIAENTGKRINLGLDDLDQYLSVARAAIAADRSARQGDPVACLRCEGRGFYAAMNNITQQCGDVACNECGGSGRAATKAAAPADAPCVGCEGKPSSENNPCAVCGIPAPAEDAREEVQELPSLYAQALDLVHEAQRASVSLVQRRLRIGWSEARDLIQLMHDRSQIPDAWLPPGVYPRQGKAQSEKEG